MNDPTTAPRRGSETSNAVSPSTTQIETLEAKGLVRLATVQPEIEYLFRHWLVQDAAYGSLLKQERRDLHARVGEVLEDLYPERRAELAAVLAMHFEAAGETEKAIDYHLAAGNYGIQRNAFAEAFSAFDRAAAILPPRLRLRYRGRAASTGRNPARPRPGGLQLQVAGGYLGRPRGDRPGGCAALGARA